MKERRTPCALLTLAAFGGEISGTHLYDPNGLYGRGGHTRFYTCNLLTTLPSLAEGGYVIDLQPLADLPNITTLVIRAPMCNGDISGDFIKRFRKPETDLASLAWSEAGDDYKAIMIMMAQEPETEGKVFGPFDEVPASYLAAYWGNYGARIGIRSGDRLLWDNGEEIAIPVNDN